MKICGACQTENDDTRVFCLNCAKRLPSSIPGSKPGLPIPAAESAGASAPTIVKRQASQAPGKLRQAGTRFSTLVFRFLILLALGAAGFAVYLILQPPEEIPRPVPPASAEESSRLANFLQVASQTPGGAWQADEVTINRFLAANVRLSPVDNPLGIQVAFERCLISLREGRMDFIMQVRVYDRSLFLRITLEPVKEGSGLGVRVVDAGLGRLPVPGPLARFLLPLWSPCFASLENALAILQKADSAQVSSKRIVVRWPVSNSR
jgi:hypothetical protein